MPLVVAVLIGVVLPVQTVINTRLRQLLRSPIRASLASFAVGTVSLATVMAVSVTRFPLSTAVMRSQPWWIWLGGVFGVIFLTGNIVLFPRLGGVQTVVMPILGQILAADAIDSFGWFASVVRPWSWARGLGTCLAIVGMVLVVAGPAALTRITHAIRREQGHGYGQGRGREQGNRDGEGHGDEQGRVAVPEGEGDRLDGGSSAAHGLGGAGRWAWRIAGVGTGALSAMQTSVNGALGVRMHSAVAASLVSFAVGTGALAIMVAIEVARRGRSAPTAGRDGDTDRQSHWWYWMGGVLGALFVFGNAVLAPILGTGLTVVVVLLGQLTGSLAVDQFGLLGAARRPVRFIQLCGVIVLMAGAAWMRLR